jgi:hypothetical protein
LATALLGSYLSAGEYSTVRGTEYGVPQCSVLGPLLFISFIDDVSGVIQFCRFHIYVNRGKRDGRVGDVPQPELFIGLDSILGFVLNRNLMPSWIIIRWFNKRFTPF